MPEPQQAHWEQWKMPLQLQAYWESISHVRNPQETKSGGEWLLAVPATNIRKMLLYATRADLWPGLPSEILTCEKCGAIVRGERSLKIHHQQWCGQSVHDAQTASRLEANTETQGVERVKKWPCSYCQKEFTTRSNRIVHERTSCRNRPPRVSTSTNNIRVHCSEHSVGTSTDK